MGNQSKKLSELALTARGGANPDITGLAVDSREVKDGFLFAALPGTRIHGGEFIQFALRMGAAAILTDAEGAEIAAEELAASDAALIVTEDPRQALAGAAALWFGAQPKTIVAVTGTNGKTSVATFVRQIWTELGYKAINIGTTGVEGAWTAPLAHTTPDPITLHRCLAQAAENGVTHVAMEASSHGLDQRRLDGVRMKAAAFSNLSRDHLDYHETFEDYFEAKARLFSELLPANAAAVINTDDPLGPTLVERAEERGNTVYTVGDGDTDFGIRDLDQFSDTGQKLRFSYKAPTEIRTYVRSINLIGDFQAHNVMLACGLVIACGEDHNRVFDTLPHLISVRGRMQLVATRENGATVFVDYAHTPEAIATALKALRRHVLGRIIAIVGAGGDRDKGKRALMGREAAKFADAVIVTDDNPRSEDPAAIRADVLLGAKGATEVGDRAEAILRGVDALQPGDALLIAGKGHETGQIVGDQILPFDDAEQASISVAALDGRVA